MTERPITIRATEIRAILNGATQLRVPLDPQPPEHLDLMRWSSSPGRVFWTNGMQWEFWPGGLNHPENDLPLPFAPGDRLWVREAWRVTRDRDWTIHPREAGPALRHYEADGEPDDIYGRPRSADTMPRWASRITLELTGDVRVERDGNDWCAVAEIRKVET